MRHTSELIDLPLRTLEISELRRVALRRYWMKKPPAKRKGEGDAIDRMPRYGSTGLLIYIVGDHPDYT